MLNWIFIMLIVFTLNDYRKNHKIFTPVTIYNAIWFITLSLYQLKLSYLQSDLNQRTINVFIAAVAVYNIASIFFNFFKFNKVKKEKNTSINSKIFIAKRIVIALFIIEVIYSGGVPLLWKAFGSSKNYFDYGISSLHGAFNGLVICLGAYSIYKRRLDSFLYLGIGILILSRQLIISMFLEAIICMIISSNKKIKRKTRRKIIKYVVLILLMFTILGNFRSGSDTMDNVFKPKEQYENLSDTTKWIYSYLTFSVSNFNNLTKISGGNINKGTMTVNELIPTVLLEKFNIIVKYDPYYLISPNFTVSTYLPPIYLDFGLYGVVTFSIIIAYLGCKSYKRMINNKTLKNKMLYSVFIHNILLLFFSNMFLYLPVIIQFIYIPIIFNGKEGESL